MIYVHLLLFYDTDNAKLRFHESRTYEAIHLLVVGNFGFRRSEKTLRPVNYANKRITYHDGIPRSHNNKT